MPELPEVHTTATKLNELIVGLIISDVWSDYFSPLFDGKNQIKNKKYFEQFKKDVLGAHIISVSRRAKNVLINLSNSKTILVHMKMTGHLLFGSYQKVGGISNNQFPNHKLEELWKNETWIPSEKENSPLWDSYNRFIHLVFSFDNQTHLVLSDVRKFGKVAVENTKTLYESHHLNTVGPEPLEEKFTLKTFKERLSLKPRGKIKQVLMDQTIISGIGNIYSDEMLWRAGIHPEKLVKNIREKEYKTLFKALKETLTKGIDLGGDSTSDYRQPDGTHGSFQGRHQAYKRKNISCLKKGCSGMMKRIVVGGRSAHFCDTHQTI